LGLLIGTLVAVGAIGGGTAVAAGGSSQPAADVPGVLVQSAAHECFLMAQTAQGAPGSAVTDIAAPTAVDGAAPLQTIVTTTAANTVVEVNAFAVNSFSDACAGVGRIIS
jgi:hypothetical protein